MKKRIFACLIAFIIIISTFPLTAFAAEPNLVYLDIGKGTISISAGTIFAYSPDGTRIRNYDSTATYVVTGTSNNTNIIVNGGAVTLILDNCNIDLSGIDDACALILKNNSNLSLGVMSDSTIKSGKNRAGIQVTTNATLNIIEPAAGTGGTLNVYGGDEAAAIGANKDKHSGNININYGTVNLYGGSNSSALGRSNGNSISNSISISGENTNVNAEGKLTAVETASLTVSSGATLNCQSNANSHAISADNTTVKNATVNATAPGKGAAIYGDRIMIKDSTLNAESAGGTAIGKRGSTYSETYTTFINSTVTVKSPDSAYVFEGYSVTITNSEIFLLGGNLKSKPTDAFVYIDKVCTYTPTKPLTIEYTVPDGHTLIVPEGTVIEVGEGGKLHEGNGTLIIEGKLYYPGTVDGTENGEAILDNFALIEDGNITWFSTFANASNALNSSNAESLILKLFADADTTKCPLSRSKFTLDLNGYNIYLSNFIVSENQEISFINTTDTQSQISNGSFYNMYDFINKGKLKFEGYMTINFNISNDGGILTLKGISGKKMVRTYYGRIQNINGGTLNLDCAHVFGDGAITNNEGCVLNLTNGASFYSEVPFYPALTNYGTVNGDNFKASGYQGAIDNSGTLNLKNGTISTQYSYPLGTSGNVYIENCTISAGSYGGAGGISGSGTLTIKDSKISLSTSDYTVGIGFKGNLTVDNCSISAGNGIILTEGTATVTNSSVYGTYFQYGSAVSIFISASMTIDKCNLYGTEGLVNGGTVTVSNSTIKSTNNWIGNEKAISNSGTLYCNNSTVKSSFTAYEGSNGTAEFKGCSIEGFDFSWDYDPIDLYGNEATFYMSGGTVRLYDTTLPGGFYVVTDKASETQYTVKDLIADNHTLYQTDDNSVAVLDENTTMLDGAYYIKADEIKLPDFGASIADLNEGNVTSDNLEVINSELTLANEYNAEDYGEEIAAKITQTKEKCNALLEVINSVKEKHETITNSAKKIIASETATDTIAEIEAIIAKADALLGSNNLTQSERADIEAAKAQLEDTAADLAERKSAIETALEKAEKIANSKPTTADEEEINGLITEIEALLSLNLTDEENENLSSAKAQLEDTAADLTERKSEIETALEKSKKIANNKPTTADEEEINGLITEIEALLSLNLTDEENEKLSSAKAQLEEITADLAERKSEIETALEKSKKIANSKPTTADEAEINGLIAEIEALLSLNLTDEENEKLSSAKAQLEDTAADLAERKSAIETALEKSEKIANGKPTTADEEEINGLIAEIEALLSLELTDEQQTALKFAKDIASTVLEKFEEERNKLAELKIEFNNIKRERVNIFDKKYLEDLSERIVLLISEGTLGTTDLEEAQSLENEVQNLIKLVQTPLFYGIIRIFWTFVSIIKAIIL